MSRKIKNTLALVAVLIIILVLGYGFIFIFQKPKITSKTKELVALKQFDYDPAILNQQLEEKLKKVNILDSLLAARKFNIPKELSQLKFYDFVNLVGTKLSSEAKFDVEYIETKPYKEFYFHEYKIGGYGRFRDLYQLIYAIEQSKELKKVSDLNLSSLVQVKDVREPLFLVNFTLKVEVLFSADDRFASSEYVENNLNIGYIQDLYYPLIRTDIPANLDALLDVQGARLLALVPEGAFLSDSRGNSYLLIEGDQVYLGYLTKIDYKNNTTKFILNKGGIVETVTLQLENEIRNNQK
ncbi:MAG: hypothetical protein KF721_03945 [Ignavibacteriaceae bacterium]|nr:hypothetical protein [Ignavibacteriaceae bacterium]HRI47429.1 hypothetical protein [Ignavibacteriaceae bacterium]